MSTGQRRRNPPATRHSFSADPGQLGFAVPTQSEGGPARSSGRIPMEQGGTVRGAARVAHGLPAPGSDGTNPSHRPDPADKAPAWATPRGARAQGPAVDGVAGEGPADGVVPPWRHDPHRPVAGHQLPWGHVTGAQGHPGPLRLGAAGSEGHDGAPMADRRRRSPSCTVVVVVTPAQRPIVGEIRVAALGPGLEVVELTPPHRHLTVTVPSHPQPRAGRQFRRPVTHRHVLPCPSPPAAAAAAAPASVQCPAPTLDPVRRPRPSVTRLPAWRRTVLRMPWVIGRHHGPLRDCE